MMLKRLATLVAIVAVIAGACGGGSSAPALTDPKDILAKSIAALQGVKTFHMHVDLSGSFKADLTGSGTASPLDLAGTTADIDVDVANKLARVTASAPALLGVTLDVIVIGQDTYTKVSLLGPKYQKSTTSADSSAAPGGASGAPTDPTQVLNEVKAALDKLATPLVKGADEKCDDQDCYKVTVTMTAADLAGAGEALGSSVTGSGTVDVWVRKNDLIPAKAVATLSAGDQGSLTITLALSKVNGTLTIQAPPADQVETTP
jgi:hypothetical protein